MDKGLQPTKFKTDLRDGEVDRTRPGAAAAGRVGADKTSTEAMVEGRAGDKQEGQEIDIMLTRLAGLLICT